MEQSIDHTDRGDAEQDIRPQAPDYFPVHSFILVGRMLRSTDYRGNVESPPAHLGRAARLQPERENPDALVSRVENRRSGVSLPVVEHLPFGRANDTVGFLEIIGHPHEPSALSGQKVDVLAVLRHRVVSPPGPFVERVGARSMPGVSGGW